MLKKYIFLDFLILALIIFILINPFIYFAEETNLKQSNNLKYKTKHKENLLLSNPGAILTYYNFQVNDDNSENSKGDGDGNIDAGETIELRLTLKNIGDEDALNVNATILSSDSFITITTAYQNFINIPYNSTGLSASFYIFEINSSCPSNYNITIDIHIEASNGGPWNDSFQIQIIDNGNPVYYSYSVYSENDGDLPADNDDIIDAGEKIVFDMILKNIGGANLYGIIGRITENDPYIIIDDNYGEFDTINSNGGVKSGRFGITISGSCPDKHQINFKLNLTDIEETLWELNFSITINGTTNYKIFDFDVIEYEGDGDTFVDAGEKWEASITIKNIGEAIGQPMELLMSIKLILIT
ncbi:MAG: hypothetical protein ACTSRH_14145 [Promethearchaeota archaeon]